MMERDATGVARDPAQPFLSSLGIEGDREATT